MRNRCELCGDQTTGEGVLCSYHWNMADGKLKNWLQQARTMIVNDVIAKQYLR